jgi:hypothetical protein
MPLRAAGDEVAELLKQPVLRASDETGAGGAPIQLLAGEAVRTLSARAKRRLLSISLGEERRRSLGLRASSSALTLFLSLRVPARHLVTSAPTFGIGVISRAGASLALIEPSFARHTSTVSSFRAFGREDAEQLLLRYVREWDRRGRPSEAALAITVTYDGRREATPRHRWRRPR